MIGFLYKMQKKSQLKSDFITKIQFSEKKNSNEFQFELKKYLLIKKIFIN